MADQQPAKSVSFHEDKDWLISKLKGDVERWKHMADYFIRRFCEETQVDYVDAWMEYEDHLDNGQGTTK